MDNKIKYIIKIFIFCLILAGCDKSAQENKNGGKQSMYMKEIIENGLKVHYDGCISCIIKLKKKYHIEVFFKNVTDYPIPIKKRLLFIGMEGKTDTMEWEAFEVKRGEEEVQYRGITIKRGPSTHKDYYILPPHGEYVAKINLRKFYDISKRGIYTVKYWAFNGLHIFKEDAAFQIESNIIQFEVK